MSDERAEAPVYGWYGDDFTGATDTLATLARRGVKAFLFLDPPDAARLTKIGPVEAIGIAGAARSMAPDAMRRELAPVGDFFAASGVRLVHYKCCSTFDSAPQTGNLAVAMDVLAKTTSAHRQMVIGGQPSLGRFCAFGNLFAAAGTGGEVWRLDRHPTMSKHPATPMAEADLRRHFQALGLDGLMLVPWTLLASGKPEIPHTGPVLFDALENTHLVAIGSFLRAEILGGQVLVTGASSVAEAFFHDREIRPANAPHAAGGPVLAIAGSLSPLSARQVAAASAYRRMSVSPDDITGGGATIIEKVSRHLEEGENVLVSTAPGAEHTTVSAQGDLAEATARFVANILDRVPVRRLAVAGGDTSSRLAQNLGLWGLSYGWQQSPGVTVSIGRSKDARRDGLQMMLKGGQMGEETIFNSYALAGQQKIIAAQ